MERQTFELTGTILFINPVETYERGKDKPPLMKKSIGIETMDGQRLFCEIRKFNFEKTEFMRVGHIVRIKYSFNGSEKNGKFYNNIIINEIDTI